MARRCHTASRSVDDFGTGYSSLSYLRHFPLDQLKLDRSFIQPLESDDTVETLVGSIVSMAHAIGLTVTAEGVETLGQLYRLRQLGCDDAQGYLLANPRSSSDVREHLVAHLGVGRTVGRRPSLTRGRNGRM